MCWLLRATKAERVGEVGMVGREEWGKGRAQGGMEGTPWLVAPGQEQCCSPWGRIARL